MKSLEPSFKKELAAGLINKQVGDAFTFTLRNAYSTSAYEGTVLHRHQTGCGVLLLVRYKFTHMLTWNKGVPIVHDIKLSAFWLSDCGNSGVMTNTNGRYVTSRFSGSMFPLPPDSDYVAALREYERPFADADFPEEMWTALDAGTMQPISVFLS